MTSLPLAALLTLLVAQPALGQKSPVAKIKRHQFLAAENLDLGDYGAARDQLLAALEVAKEADLGKELLTAKTHVLLGAVYANHLGDEANAVEQFKAALVIAPGIQIEPPHDTDAAKSAFAQAERALSPAGECQTLRGIQHVPVTKAETGVATEIACRAEDILLPGSAEIAYQLEDADYATAPMKRKGPCSWVGSIPADEVRGDTINYFITIKSDAGKVFARRGNPKVPFTMTVEQTEKSPPPEFERRDEVPDELTLPGRPKQPKGGGCAGCTASEAGALPGLPRLIALASMMLALGFALRRPRSSRGAVDDRA